MANGVFAIRTLGGLETCESRYLDEVFAIDVDNREVTFLIAPLIDPSLLGIVVVTDDDF